MGRSLEKEYHNTLYKNTRGIKGLKDKIKSGIKASIERLKK